MKFLIMFTGLGLSLFMGLFWGMDKPKPTYWKIISVSIIFISAFLTFLPPTAGTFSDAIDLAHLPEYKNVDVFLKLADQNRKINNLNTGEYILNVLTVKQYTISKKETKQTSIRQLRVIANNFPIEFNNLNNNFVVNLSYDSVSKMFVYNYIKSIDPIMTYPYIPALLDRIRNLNYHVPMSWTASIAFCISMVFSFLYIRKKEMDYDIKASSAALLGLVFVILATTTGMIWAKFNWGSFWNWDPRQVTIFVLMLVYFAYFALRFAIEDNEKRAMLSSIYSMLSFVTVPFLIFIIPRLTPGLHPGAKADGNVGPVISTQQGMLDSSLVYTYYFSLAGFIILFFWLYNLHIRYQKIRNKVL